MNANRNVFFDVVKGVALTYILNIVFLLIYATILSFTDVSEATIPTVIFVISLLGVFISSSLTTIKIKENGLKYGAIIGLVYILILYLIGCTTSVGFSFTAYSLATIVFNIFIGMVGGVVGVNLVKN